MKPKIIKKFIWGNFEKRLGDIRAFFPDTYARKSYSQEGEDMILRRIFERQKCGFYVDVGAHHPMRFSNTHYFYRKGWRGINIDATPGSMILFNRHRPRDINLEMAISNQNTTADYYLFNEPALNTFDEKLAREWEKIDIYNIVEVKPIKTHTLKEIFHQYLPLNSTIDFLNIDVEGMDRQILESMDWENFIPTVILCEALSSALDNLQKDKTYQFLKAKGYFLMAKTFNTYIFKKSEE